MNLISRFVSQRWQNRVGVGVQLLSFIVSVLFIAAAIIDYGFTLSSQEMVYLDKIYHFVQFFFVVIFTTRLVTNWRHIWKYNFVLTIVLGLLLYLSAIPDLLPAASAPQWLARFYHAFSEKFYMLGIVGIFAVMEISRGIVSIIRRKTNPALLLASAFLVIIFFGTILLMVPRSTLDGVTISMVDALYVATSAVCVTGLSTVDIATTFSTEGLIVIALLIQVGGLGVMTITSFFALFFMGNTGLYDQFALRDMVSSDTFTSLMSTLLYILGFTIGIELIGAFAIWTTVHGTLGMNLIDEVFFSIFHSISAFCNAGFSTLSGNLGNTMLIQHHGGFYITISLLIILGGIGFPILVNIKNALFYYIHYAFSRIIRHKTPVRIPHLAKLNTKIAVSATIILLVVGTVAIAISEWNGAFAGMSITDKLVHSFFNATSPRTAGFNSVDLSQFSLLTLILYIILMWIGGASQSTAGGIKVNTIGVAFASFMSTVRDEKSVTMFNRTITDKSVKRAYATIFGSVMVIIVCFVTLVIIEPKLDAFDLLFESISALSTVGSSLGITASLSTASKIIFSAMMFIGRVGLITVAMSLFASREHRHYQLPEENVIIN
ncbi:MAG: potassium transporter [Rikenellaceae bacterium]|nr:potassium transporter [Rikenellaceae bacterium]